MAGVDLSTDPALRFPLPGVSTMRLLRWPSLPLFSKELIEQSNRRRTFVIRVVYAVLTYLFLLFILWERMGSWNTNSLALMGRGRDLFEMIVGLQFFAIYAFLPGLACSVLTAEKERDTLAMLLLTKLGAWTILIEKLLSRLMPMGFLLLLSLPLLAVAYSLGGVEPWMIVYAVWVLLLTGLQVGALALFCSAWFRTTAGAFVGTYVLGFGLIMGPIFMILLLYELGRHYGLFPHRGPREAEFVLHLFGPYVFFEYMQRGMVPFGAPPAVTTSWGVMAVQALVLFLRSSALWISTIVFLCGARFVLWRRAFIQPKQRILQFFRWLDGIFLRINQNRVTKGIVLINESVSLPLFKPISWRETSKKTLGTTRYLVRFLLVVEPPLLFFLLLADLTSYRSNNNDGMTPGVFPNIFLWLMLVISITVLSTGLIAGEKTKQTLDVLLSTPLTIKELIDQKLSAVKKLTRVMWIPLLTVLVFDAWWLFHVIGGFDQFSPGLFLLWLVQRLLPMIVYPALVCWIGFHFGMRLKNQGQAMLATVAVIAAWCITPAFLHSGLSFIRDIGVSLFGRAGWAIFSPVLFIIDPLRKEMIRNYWRASSWMSPADEYTSEFLAYVFHFGLCLAWWIALRWWGYRSFAQVVHRNEGTEQEQVVTNPASALGWLSK